MISEPKTTHSRRQVPLHATTVSMLRKHRIAQMEERWGCRQAVAGAFRIFAGSLKSAIGRRVPFPSFIHRI